MKSDVIAKKLSRAEGTGVLALKDGKLAQLPDGIENIAKLRTLDVSGNKLTEFSLVSASLTNLNLSRNKLTQVNGLDGLPKLSKLTATDNPLSALPPLPPGIKHIDLSRTRFSALPAAALASQSLAVLDMTGCAVADLPVGGWASASALHTLVLDDNGVIVLPDALAQAPALHTLSVKRNRVGRVPPALLRAPALVVLDLAGNPIAREALRATDGFDDFLQRRKAQKDKALQGGLNPKLDLCGLD